MSYQLSIANNKIDFVIRDGVIDNNMDVNTHRILMVLNTFKGEYSINKEFGIDYIDILKNNPNIVQKLRHEINKYLQIINKDASFTVKKEKDSYNITINKISYRINI